jgi:Na+-driven multidrug efflux pump
MIGGDIVFQLIMLIMLGTLVVATIYVARSIIKGKQKRSHEEARLSSIEDKLDDVIAVIEKKKPE